MDFRHRRNLWAKSSGGRRPTGGFMERVVIYGGTGGIGLATARALRGRGAALHLVGRDPERLERAASELGETGFRASPRRRARASAASSTRSARSSSRLWPSSTQRASSLISASTRSVPFWRCRQRPPRSRPERERQARAWCCSPPSPSRRASRTMPRSPWPRGRSRGSPSRWRRNSRPRSG
ncbi:Hypothetical protein MexAM1_META1p0831 [Methylorubrum extorquens AM1]|uniref:SDR family NAD(P)-dependent oxidoreductase n=1 Tax=Methylorubrum extorquens (strain ATCC 14718 / DSM 1338 / JCM 2805 / NCIMB 9133 / AM1) TaxID=272630 RepID=C5AWC4_METEA|nr:Hypothetical protein MexAM1_META1p0831 [Methylorubrum extorquens AM1]